MKRFILNMKNLLVYSDSDLLELVLAIVLGIVNPLKATIPYLNTIWHLSGTTSSILILFGLGSKCLKTRETGLLLALVNLTAINLIEATHFRADVSYVVQNLVVGFLWWKVNKQRVLYEVRKECSGGKL